MKTYSGERKRMIRKDDWVLVRSATQRKLNLRCAMMLGHRRVHELLPNQSAIMQGRVFHEAGLEKEHDRSEVTVTLLHPDIIASKSYKDRITNRAPILAIGIEEAQRIHHESRAMFAVAGDEAVLEQAAAVEERKEEIDATNAHNARIREQEAREALEAENAAAKRVGIKDVVTGLGVEVTAPEEPTAEEMADFEPSTEGAAEDGSEGAAEDASAGTVEGAVEGTVESAVEGTVEEPTSAETGENKPSGDTAEVPAEDAAPSEVVPTEETPKAEHKGKKGSEGGGRNKRKQPKKKD